jgi:hypothetical protein
MATYNLTMPFLDGDSRFAAGVEFGMLHARLRDPDVDEIADYFTLVNQDQILLAASRLGWRVEEMREWDGAPDQWFWVRLVRKGKTTA